MVAIKNFGMPSCCDNCDIFDWTEKICHITYTRCEEPFDIKNNDCPLIEVEPQESEIEKASDKCPICIHRNNSCQFGLDCHFKEQKF